jgi:hypothetical protein
MSTAPSPAPDPGPALQAIRRKISDLLFLLPIVYAVFVALIFAIAWRAIHAQQTPTPPKPKIELTAPLDTSINQEGAKLDQLKTRLELEQDYLDKRAAQLDKRADDLEHLIAEMTLGSSIYIFLLGLFAYFSLKTVKADAEADLAKIEDLLDNFKKNEFADFQKDLQDRASREIDRARAEFESFRAEVRNDIPELYGMASSLGVILDRIRRQVDISRNWTLRESYEVMTEEERQTILVAEMTVAGFDYFGLPASKRFRAVAAEIYLNLARFYAARSRMIGHDGEFKQVDMRRAFIYMDRACSTDPGNPRTFSQRAAMILVDIPKQGEKPTKEQFDRAESDLDRCLAIKPADVRSLYNLAWIARRRGNLPRAIELVTTIIDLRETLEPEDRGRRIIDAFTNRACYRAIALSSLLSDAAQRAQVEAETRLILADCQAACEEGKLYNLKEYCRQGFTREFSANGDLSAIKSLLSDQTVSEVIACA